MANTWYLGPVGALVAIPAPARGIDSSPGLVGKVSVSLNGTQTLYRAAQPRTWNCQWNGLTEDQSNYLRMVGHGLVRSPLRLIDGEIRNRLPLRVATGGSYSKSAVDFGLGHFTSASTPTWVAITDPPAMVLVRGAVSWDRTGTGVADLTIANSTDRVPLLPTLEQIRLSMWVRGTAINVFPSLDVYDASGNATHVYGGSSTLLDPVVWKNVTFTYTPGSTDAEVAPALHIQAGEAVSTIQTTGWQIAPSAASTVWAVGGGAPTVLAGAPSAVTTAGNTATTTGLSDTYIYPGVRQFGLTLIERLM